MADVPKRIAVWIYAGPLIGESPAQIVNLADLPQTLRFGAVQVVLEDAREA